MSAKFSKNAVDALNASASCARQLGHDHIGSEHIFLALLAIPTCQACQRLEKLGLSIDDLAESMRTMISGSSQGVLQRGDLPITSRTRKVMQMAELEAGKGNVVGTVPLVTAMLREGENAAAQLLFNAGVTAERFIAAGTQGGGNGADAAADESDAGDGAGDGDEPDGADGEDGQGKGVGAKIEVRQHIP